LARGKQLIPLRNEDSKIEGARTTEGWLAELFLKIDHEVIMPQAVATNRTASATTESSR
jgi:hypothetical protein